MPEMLETMQEVRAVNTALPYRKGALESGRCHAPSLKRWKEQGKKIIGFQCTYIPEEVIYAAGIMPVRITGGEFRELELEQANAWMYINTCSFIRSCIELVLEGHYNFLDGFVTGSTCDPPRRLADVWIHKQFTPFVHVLNVPRKYTERALALYRQEVMDLKQALEESYKVEITDQALRDAIKVYDKTRDLFRRLYDLRKSDTPPITGAEVMELYNAMYKMTRDDFNDLLGRLVDEASSGKRVIEPQFRLMINGSPLNNPEFIRCMEETGALIVVDELCTGSRYWWDSVNPAEDVLDDPLGAICRRYLNNQPCARMMPSEERFRRILEMVREFKVQAVVSEIVRYCVPYAHDQPFMRKILEEQGIPVLELDVEYGMGGIGQVKTRVQAFLEMLEYAQK